MQTKMNNPKFFCGNFNFDTISLAISSKLNSRDEINFHLWQLQFLFWFALSLYCVLKKWLSVCVSVLKRKGKGREKLKDKPGIAVTNPFCTPHWRKKTKYVRMPLSPYNNRMNAQVMM